MILLRIAAILLEKLQKKAKKKALPEGRAFGSVTEPRGNRQDIKGEALAELARVHWALIATDRRPLTALLRRLRREPSAWRLSRQQERFDFFDLIRHFEVSVRVRTSVGERT